MFGFLKNLLRKQPDAPAGSEPGYSEAASPSQFEASNGGRITPSYKLAGHSGRGVEVPLRSILGQLPLELQPRVLQTQVGDLSLSVPLEKILSQLSRGNVRISFGELRQAAPGL
ncbi:hypothetical protein EG829_32985, partial [bacterium]|nr:hypothetical protein [bacterium]